MPNTRENPFYIYWDKVLLLVLAVIGVYVVVTRVISSPLSSNDFQSQSVGPTKMVDQITEKAEALDISLQQAAPENPEESETVEKVRGYLQGETAELSFNPLVSWTAGNGAMRSQEKIATPPVLAPLDLRVRSGIGLRAAGSKTHWVTIAADFPFRKQFLAFAGINPPVDDERRLDEEDHYFLFARLELERIQLLPDGSWSDPQIINPYETYQQSLPNIVKTLTELYSLPSRYEKPDLNNLQVFRQWLSQRGFQEFIVRPEFFALDGFEQWYWPEEPPDTSEKRSTSGRTTAAGAVPRDGRPKYTKALYKPSERAYQPKSYPVGISGADIRTLPTTVEPSRRGSASTERIPLPRDYRPQDAPDSIPIWVHDASVEPGTTYRYQLRVSLFNPLCGDQQADRAVRRKAWLSGEWSGWSEPVKTLQDRYFFFTGVSPRIGSRPPRARIQIYAWDKGYWYRQFFYYSHKGQTIGSPKDVSAAALLSTDPRRILDTRAIGSDRTQRRGPAIPPRIKIDFTTGWTIVEFNPEITIERPVDGKPGEFKTVYKLLVKNAKTGQEITRYSDLDKDDPQRKALDENIKRQDKARRPPASPSAGPSKKRPPPSRGAFPFPFP